MWLSMYTRLQCNNGLVVAGGDGRDWHSSVDVGRMASSPVIVMMSVMSHDSVDCDGCSWWFAISVFILELTAVDHIGGDCHGRCGENCDECPDVPEILPEHQTGWNIKYELNHALRIFNKISSNPTTATAISTSPPIRRNFWNGDFCGLLKSISQEELNDDHCLTKNPGMTAFIRAHCFMRCCQGRKNRCPNLTKQTLWARQYTLKHALKVFNGISSNRS